MKLGKKYYLYYVIIVFCHATKKCENSCVEGKGETYNGVVSKTASGRTCQRWDRDFDQPDWEFERPDPAGLICDFFIRIV